MFVDVTFFLLISRMETREILASVPLHKNHELHAGIESGGSADQNNVEPVRLGHNWLPVVLLSRRHPLGNLECPCAVISYPSCVAHT